MGSKTIITDKVKVVRKGLNAKWEAKKRKLITDQAKVVTEKIKC